MLPYSTQELQYRADVYQPNQIPIRFNLRGPNEVLQSTDYIIASAINALSASAGQNFLRIFAHNATATNNYANDNANTLCQILTDLVIVDSMLERRYSGYDQAIAGLSQTAVNLYIALLVDTFVELRNMLTPDIQQAVASNLGLLNKLAADVDNLRRGGGQQRNNYPQNNYPQNNYPPQHNPHSGPPGYRQHPQQTGSYPQNNYARSLSEFQQPTTQREFHGYKFSKDDDEKETPIFSGYNFADKGAEPTPVKKEVEASVSELKWVPSPEQPYRLLRTSDLKSELVVNIDGQVMEVLERNTEVREDEHRIRHLGNDYDNQRSIRLAEINNQVNRIASLTTAHEEVEKIASDEVLGTPEDVARAAEVKKALSQFVNLDTEAYDFLEVGIFEGLLKKIKANSKSGVYQFSCSTMNPIPCYNDNNEIICQFNSSKSFASLHEKIVSYLELEPDNMSEEELESRSVVYEYDRRIVGYINDALKAGLGLPGVKIGSFVEDYDDLTACLVKKGEIYQKAFKKFERHLFSSLKDTFSYMDLMSYHAAHTDNEYTATYIQENVCVTYLDVYECELGIVFDAPAALITENTPILYAVAESITSTKCSDNVTRLLVTKDRKIYKLCEGYLVSGTCLLMKA